MDTEPYKKVQSAYDQIVREYAKQNHFTMGENIRSLARVLIEHIGQQGHMVDIGCGTGRDMAWFESQEITVTGIDLSIGMLSYAREQIQGSLAAMNMRYFGFRDGCFDGAWCCASFLHIPKNEAPFVLKEIHRVLKPDGMLILSVQKGNSESWDGGYVSGVKRFFARYQIAEMREMLLENHFSVREVRTSKSGIREWLWFVCIASS